MAYGEDSLIPMETLDRMIQMGWGSTVREEIPTDWHTRLGPHPPSSSRFEILEGVDIGPEDNTD